jgi:nitrate reductase (NAD(P)H)
VGNYSVKHLTSLTVSSAPSDNFFFTREASRLPLHVDAAMAGKERLWGKPEFRVTDAPLNSVVCCPAHNDVLMLADDAPYTLKGFAFAGTTPPITTSAST